jgi:hypothetical protein
MKESLSEKLKKEIFNDSQVLPIETFKQRLGEVGGRLGIKIWVLRSKKETSGFVSELSNDRFWGRVLKFEGDKVTLVNPSSSS